MKRRTIIGLSVTIFTVAFVIGIASLPDEVLIESSSVNNSPTLTEKTLVTTKEETQESISEVTNVKNIDTTKAEIDSLKKEIIDLKNEIVKIKTDSEDIQDIPIKTEEKDLTVENSHDVSQGKVITISISDGVGAKSQ